MPTENGKDWRIKIGDGADPEVFTNIGGELSFDWNRSSQEIDDSSKDDGMYGSTSYGQQKVAISANGNVKLPDTGLERASGIAKTSPPEVNIQICKGALVKYQGRMAIGNFSTSFPKDGPATYRYDLANKGVPTIDDLGATA